MLDAYVKLLKSGGIVAFPTETVYGLGADAWNPSAIKKVFSQKRRPADNPLIVHVSSPKMVEDFASEITDDARKLMQRFWPGPLTLILPKKPEVLDVITAGLDTVAIRWPKHPLSQELIAQAGPLVAPSANSSGKPSPTRAAHVKEDFGDDFPVIEAGETDIGLESTVLDITRKPYQIYRPGAVSAKEIADVTGQKVELATSNSEAASPKSPGTKYTHYAPDADVNWLRQEASILRDDSLYLLHSLENIPEADNIIHYCQDFRRMAHELFDRFRQADHLAFKHIFVEPLPDDADDPIIQALKNRISKALA